MTDPVRRALHDMLTYAKKGALTCDRTGLLHVNGAPGTLEQQLSASVLYSRGWLQWTKTKTAITARPSFIGDIVLALWDDTTDSIVITEADERELLQLQYDVRFTDEIFGPPATSNRPLSGLTNAQLEAEARRLIGDILGKDMP